FGFRPSLLRGRQSVEGIRIREGGTMKLRSALGRSMARWLALALLPASLAGITAVGVAAAKPSPVVAGCQLSAGPVKHVIYLVFDNTHLLRDRSNVASDLEQMPHL